MKAQVALPTGAFQMHRTYTDAMALLKSRRRSCSASWSGDRSDYVARINDKTKWTAVTSFRGKPSLDPMGEWLRQLGYKHTDLSIIHIAGTKGKGSTCMFTESILREHGRSAGFPASTGVFTSPPLVTIRERIQINRQPIAEELFAQRFFEVWDCLWDHIRRHRGGIEDMPRFRQFMMLLSFHVFAKASVDVAIYETYCGGEFDCTNVVNPIVTGITTLALDHVRMLGPTLGDVAWHKAGIFKAGVPSFSSPQQLDVTRVLQRRASEKRISLRFVGLDPAVSSETLASLPGVQKTNASLAIALANSFLKKLTPGHELGTQDVLSGIAKFSLPGRLQRIKRGNDEWFLDIAHNALSLEVATQWFLNTALLSSPTSERILIFQHPGNRDLATLLKVVFETLRKGGMKIQYIIFTAFQQRRDGSTNNDFDLVQSGYLRTWRALDPSAQLSLASSAEEALMMAEKIGCQGHGMQAYVTGSVNLVGCALALLEPELYK